MKRILTVISLLVICSYNMHASQADPQADILHLLSKPYGQMVHEVHALTLQLITSNENDENKPFNDFFKENIQQRLSEIELWMKTTNDSKHNQSDNPKKILENVNSLGN